MRNPEAHQFLTDLWRHLNQSLLPVIDVPLEVEKEAREVYPSKPSKKSVFLEGALVSRFITPQIHRFIVTHAGLNNELASESLISENKIDKTRGYANKAIVTAHPFRHPFGKSLGKTAREIANRWYAEENALSSKHPDLCLTMPYRILIEAKYLQSKKFDAGVELVKSVYEALFYRGLAAVKDGKRLWDYDFAVALVYDGTPDGSFCKAWEDLSSDVRNAIWNAANIFVMPIRGTDTATSA